MMYKEMITTMSPKKRLGSLIVVSVLLLSALSGQSVQALGTSVDDFSTSQPLVFSFASGLSACGSVTTVGPDILGSERDLEVQKTAGAGLVYASFNGNVMSYSQGDGDYGYARIQWDGDDDESSCPDTLSYTGLGADLQTGGADRFIIRVVTKDLAGGGIIVSVYTDASNWATASATNLPAGPQTVELPFGSFGGGNGTLNWHSVGAIVLEIDGRTTSSLDMSIDWVTTGTPTAVGLSSFTATPASRAIQVEWETATELDNLGFNLYRAESADGPWAQLNESLIACQAPGSQEGAAYTFEDRDVHRGTTYYYQLEDLDVYGQSTFHGPVNAGLQASRIDLFRPRPQPAQTERNR
jgi:hypothetical protein